MAGLKSDPLTVQVYLLVKYSKHFRTCWLSGELSLPFGLLVIISIRLEDRNVFARFDEIPSITL